MIVQRAFLLLTCLSLLAQQSSTSDVPGAVFRVTSTLVQVDAVVTDSKGRYVKDLAASDFEIDEDGRPQKITHFSYVQVGGPQPVSPVSRTKTSQMLNAPPNAALRREDVQRAVVLMVDDLALTFEDMAWVRSSLRKFVEKQVQPGDLVAICRTGSGSGALQQFTNDKRILLAAVDALRWNPSDRTSILEPYGKYSQLAENIAIHNPIGTTLDPIYDAEQNSILTMGTLAAINDMVAALREIPGRKSIVLFSDGIDLRGQTQVSGIDISRGDIVDGFRKLVDRANRAGVVFYTMQAIGLANPFAPGADNRVQFGGLSNAPPALAAIGLADPGSIRHREFNALQQGLAKIAYDTGGLAYQNGNDLNWGLDRVLEDEQGYYLIAYQPPSDTFADKLGDRAYHHVTVRVKRASLHVRSRSGFFGETDDEVTAKRDTVTHLLHTAMLSPFESSGVRLRLTSLYAESPEQRPLVRSLLHIETDDLKFRSEGDASIARAQIIVVITGVDGLPIGTLDKTYTFRSPTDTLAENLRGGVVYTVDIAVPKRGPFQIHVAVRDSITGKVGTASQFLEVPDLKKHPFALTSVVLQNGGPSPEGTGYSESTAAKREFHSGARLQYLCVVETAPNKGVPASQIDARVRIMQDDQQIYSGPARLAPVEKGGLAIIGSLQLSERMSPGDYYLGIVATAHEKRKNLAATQWTDFKIVP